MRDSSLPQWSLSDRAGQLTGAGSSHSQRSGLGLGFASRFRGCLHRSNELVHEVERPPLRLDEDLCEVLANDASRSSCTPEISDMGITMDAQPGTAALEKSLTPSAQTPMPRLNSDTNMPSMVIARSGTAENDVTPCQADASIFVSGYLESPAKRSWRSYSTVVEAKPNCGISPRRKTFDSGNARSASIARRLSSR